MTTARPTPKQVEVELRAAVAQGRQANFAGPPWNRPSIPASLIRELVIGAKAPSGVQIEGATITGVLDLSEARGTDGIECNPLILEECSLTGGDEFHPGLDAHNSRLSRVALSACRVQGIDLSNAMILGDLTIDGLVPGGAAEDKPCWIRARGLRVEGAVKLANAKLKLPSFPTDVWPPTDPILWPDARTPFALDLRDARISGSLSLRPNFESIGGVSIAGATVGGEFWAEGARLMAPGIGRDATRALFAQGVDIRGLAALQCRDGQRFQADGDVWFYLAKIGGVLSLRGAKLGGLTLHSASIAGSLYVDDDEDDGSGREDPCMGTRFEVEGRVDLTDVAVGGSATVETHSRSMAGDAMFVADVAATGLKVGRDLTLRVDGRPVDLSDAQIGGMVRVEAGAGFTAWDAAFENSMDLNVGGKLELNGTRVAGNATIGNFVNPDDGASMPITSIAAPGLKIGRDLNLAGALAGPADFGGSVIDGNLRLGTAGMPLTLDARRRQVAPDVRMVGVSVRLGLQVNEIIVLRETDQGIDGAVAKPRRIRTAALTVFPGWRLAEASFEPNQASDVAILAFIYRPDDLSKVVLLNGESARIHDHDMLGKPLLDEAKQVEVYLSFFCAHVWGDEGAFDIVDPSSPMADLAENAVQESPQAIKKSIPKIAPPTPAEDGSWTAVADVRYGEALFRAKFRIERSGDVTMTEDWPLRELPADARWGLAAAPFRRIHLPTAEDHRRFWDQGFPPPLGPGAAWDTSPGPLPSWHEVQKRLLGNVDPTGDYDLQRRPSRPTIDLRAVVVGSLDDQDGRGWGTELVLKLDGFEYDRIFPVPEQSKAGSFAGAKNSRQGQGRDEQLKARVKWLLGEDLYRPQPFEQLAKVWRAEGWYANATEITFQRLNQERKLSSWPLRDGIHVGNRHFSGLTFWTLQVLVVSLFVVLLALLTWGVISGDAWGSVILVGFTGSGLLLLPPSILKRLFLQVPFGYGLKTSRALAVFVFLWVVGGGLVILGTQKGLGDVMKVDASAIGTVVQGTDEVVVPVGQGTGEPEIRCGNQIDPMLYALDVMVPLLDLRQEQRCTVSADPGAWFWRFVKVAYAVAGWVVVSGLVLTASGFVRRQIER